MTNPARRLLDLSLEYADARDARVVMAGIPGAAIARDPDEIAAEYAAALREVLASGDSAT